VDLTLGLQLLGLVVLLALSAFFSSSETSLFSLDRTQIERLKQEKHPRAALIERLLSRPRQLLVTILIGNELVNISATVLSAVIIVRLVGAELSWINVFVMVPVLLLFGEVTPKTLAIGHNVGFASFQSVLIDRFARLIGPVRWVVRRVSEFFITMIVGEERTAANIATEDMVRVLAAEAVGEGVIDASEAKYIHQVFNFGDKMVRDIATQRSRLFMVPVGMPLAQMAAEIDITRHTKVPVHEDGDKDAILGILFARDLLGLNLQETDREAVAKLVRNAHFVPETLSAASLFVTFRTRRLSLALTVDEFGGITGLVTMEDLLECIFGEIESGSERRRRQRVVFEKLGDGRFRMDARMTVRQFNELLGCDFGDERSETIGGILLSEFGHLPDEGSKVRIDGIELTVVSVSGQRIANILAEPSVDALAADETAQAELVEPSERTEG